MEKDYDFLEAIEKLKLDMSGICTLGENTPKLKAGIKRADSSFKALFEVKSHFVELVKTFIKEDWVNEINEEDIELTTNEFILEDAHKRTSDLVYKVKIDGKELYFFLLELQSSVDYKMPYRLLEYMFEIWRRFEKKDKLPIIIPCVVYTGQAKWNVGDFRSLFDGDERLKKYIPNFEYILIDVNRYSDEELLNIANLISSVFFVNKTKGGNDSIKRLEAVVENVSKISQEQQSAFIRWSETMLGKNNDVYNYFEENIEKEVENMAFADYVPEMIEILKEEGRVEGIRKGIAQEKLNSIKRLLNYKLKSGINNEVVKLINEASLDKLDEVERKIFEISSWEEVEEIIKS